MTKSELKTGMIVTLRNGQELVVFKDDVCNNGVICNGQLSSWFVLESFGEDLTHQGTKVSPNSMYDIIRVDKPFHPYCYSDINYERKLRTLLWKREEIKEVTMAEVEEKFGCKVKIIS